MVPDYETLKLDAASAVLFVSIDAPPMNLMGPSLVRDMVSLIEHLDRSNTYKVVVFGSADPEYFISHVDVTQVAQYRSRRRVRKGYGLLAVPGAPAAGTPCRPRKFLTSKVLLPSTSL
jgi:enoyl-CoA hydratase/carnithine racemase